MKSSLVSISSCGLLVLVLSKGASAQVAAPPPPAYAAAQSEEPPDSALLLQARMQTQESIFSVVSATPGFLIGYQLRNVAIGVGVGFTRIGVTTDNEGGKISGSIFQVSPTIILDVWQSRDRRTRANIVGSVGYGKASLSSTSTSRVCTFDVNGNETCTTSQSESKSSATLIPVQIGFGGDHFLGRHFGIGAEAGLQLAFISGIESGGQSVNGSANAQAMYGLLRMTLLVGD